MTETRIKFSNIVQNQLPSYVREDFPLVSEFLSQYYISQEFKGAAVDLIQNIDSYIKIDEQTNQVENAIVSLSSPVSITDDVINVEFDKTISNGTYGFPDSYGLIQIDDEIITYTGKTAGSFTGCIRGFSGITFYNKQNHPDELIFSQSEVSEHAAGATIINLSSLFLKEFLLKSKYQLTPGFENRTFSSDLNQSLFIKQAKDFYRSKGTDESFRILFKVLYGENVSIIRPKDFLFRPSDAHYDVTKDLVVESISGDPLNLVNSTLIQDTYGDITKAYAPVAKVEKIISEVGNTYYKLSLDAGYDKDLNVDGAIYGNFSIHPKTKLIGQVSAGTTVLSVDSTVGFNQSGELSVTYNDGTSGAVSYSSKSLTQFFDCSNITATILDSTNIGINTFAYGIYEGQPIKVKINSVLKNLDIVDDTYYYVKGDTAEIKTLGVNPKDAVSNNWLFNIATSYNVVSFIRLDTTNNTYKIIIKNDHIFKIGDKLKIISESGVEKTSSVIDITSSNSLIIKGQGELLENNYIIKRELLKVSSSTFPSTSILNANVQNIYKIKDRTLVASPSLPYYNNQDLNISDKSVIFSGTFEGDTFKITSSTDHGFYTGDMVYYTPEKSSVFSTDVDGNTRETIIISSSLFDEGIYYIKRIDSNNIKLAKSRLNIQNSKFLSIDNATIVNLNKIESYKFKSKALKSQKLLREITSSEITGELYPTKPGLTGILINGVEILNYKSTDTVSYGELESIEVLSPGSGYDIINPPSLYISDLVGTGATGYCAVKGNLNQIRIIDPGFDYQDIPIIKITGGNGRNAKASVNMKLITHQVNFNSQSNASLVGLGSTLSTIGFSTYHKFTNSERVIYKVNGQTSVGGLSTDSSYYVSVQTPYVIKLHKTLNDSVSGINTVVLTSYGTGTHAIESYNKKSILASINIIDSGSGYENKVRTTSSSGISTSLNSIEIKNHDFKSGEIITYTTDGVTVGGLSTNTNYYITKIDNDNFKLSQVGLGVTNQDFYYNTNQYIVLNSIGSGTHIFNYPEISVELLGNIGISSINNETFKATVQPIFKGEITSIHLSSKGSEYGTSDILNYNRLPLITLNSGSGGQLVPIISDGKIVEVLVNSKGSNYNSPPNLTIIGDGTGAVITPIIQNGKIESIKVIESGIGYNSSTTSIKITSNGSFAEFLPKITTWNVNLFEKYFYNITSDDGFITEGINKEYELQYSHLYAPRKLREIIYSVDASGKSLYGRSKVDLQIINDVESSPLKPDHSPIIGWSYDGNPIYGPYGYISRQGGVISQVKSGYTKVLKPNRPSLIEFPLGFFIEDYVYFKSSDDTVLDENNGRFCVTPEFPNGTYAYFATINTLADSSGVFAGYKRPIFPYLIGKNYKSKPNEFNFKKSSNQEEIDLNKINWSRNTSYYNLINENGSYDYLTVPNLLNQTADVKYASPGFIENIGIVTGGNNYKVNDSVVFNESGTFGYNASVKVSRLKGKSINSVSVATSTISSVEIYPTNNTGSIIIFASNPHNYSNKDIISISGLNTTSALIEGSYQVGISTINTLSLVAAVGTTAITGLVTYFSVSGNLNPSYIRENDVFTVGNEKIKILNIDTISSRIRVLRSVNDSVGSAHTATEVLYENPRKLIANSGFKTSYDYKINKQIYFNPVESIGLGTISGVGIGTTIFFSNPGAGITQIFIPTKTIYIPNHQLETGDQLTYSTNNGNPLVVSFTGIGTTTISNNSSVYVAKISNDLIGIATVKVGLGSTGTFVGIASTTSTSSTLYFAGIGSGIYHSFQTNYSVFTGKISKNTVTVSTAETHGLRNNDTVFINVNPSISTSITVKYNDYNRKLLINPKTFSSIGIDTSSNSITITNHKFINGQKVVHTSTSPAIGLQNNKIYYIVLIDSNTIKLSNTYYSAVSLQPEIVQINSSSTGTLSSINPPIEVYKNSIVTFDLSDSSLSYANQSNFYPAFNLQFYKNSNFTELFDSSKETKTFEIQKFGTVGISSDAKVVLSVNEYVPEKLYYTLVPVYDSTLPIEKEQVNIDSSVFSNNEIQVKVSSYNGQYPVTIASTNSFTYNLAKTPESVSYASSISILNYDTDSLYAYGPISKLDIVNKGQNYYSLPSITNINSGIGTGALLEPSSTSIGKIKKTKIKDIGFDFPSDFTIRPSVSLPQIAKVEPLSSFESIGINFFGRGYTSAPKLLVFDGKTNQIVPEVDLRYNLGDTQVTILRNSYGLYNLTPTILPIQNPNGVGINSVGFNTTTNDVTITLSVGFSTADSFPFAVNDKVLVENISVGVNSTGKGYNSSDYNYQLFTINYVDANLGGSNATVRYSLNGFLNSGEIPGTYDASNSSGRIIPQKYFPIFNTVLKQNNFFIDENVKSNSANGYVDDWDSKVNYLKINSKEDFVVGEMVEGLTSKAQGIISSIERFDSFFILNSKSTVEKGWQIDAGFLNENSQKIQDSYYYQNFSYSLKSKVDYDTWNDAVSTLNHTLGLKKFADYQLEGSLSENSMIVGLSTLTTSVEIINDIINVVDLNCVYDFDLVSENALNIGSSTFSDEIKFSSRVLTDYFESVGNRVLSIDDISPQFNSNPRATRFSEVHRFNITNARSQKYITYVKDRRYTTQRQIMLLTLLHDNSLGYINQYGRVESTYDQGSFDFGVEGSEGVIFFYPTKYSVNDYDITTLSYNLKDSLIGTGNSNFGGIVDIKTSSVSVSSGATTIVGIASTYTSAKVLVEITGSNGDYQFDELSVLHDGTTVNYFDYGQLTTISQNIFSNSGLGTYYSYLSGSQLKIDFTPNVGIAATINTIQVAIGNTLSSGIGTFDMKHARLQATSTSIFSSASPIATVIAEYPDNYDCLYGILQISDTTNNRHQLSEIIVLDDGTETYITEYANIETFAGLGTVGAATTSLSTKLTFTPLPNINVKVKIFFNALRNQDDDKDLVDFNNASIETNYGNYYGTDRDITRAFDLKHEGNKIFQRSFDGSNSSIINLTSNTISLPNHFFVTGEEVVYTNIGFGTTGAIGIATTSFVSVGSTDKLPSSVYVVKLNNNSIKLARSAEDALKSSPATLDFTSVGIGTTTHTFTSKNQNAKVIVAIDNLIQSPVVATAITTTLAINAYTTDDLLYFTGISSFYGGDLIKVGDEIMRIDGVGIGSTNSVRVRRPWLGTIIAGYSTGTLVTKIFANYNIVDNTLNFAEAPYGNVPIVTDNPDEQSWSGISTSSSFQGRSFLRSGEQNTTNETYYKNYIFDDISSQFDANKRNFTLKSNRSNITGISSNNAVILINDIFQSPGLTAGYTLTENVGITSINFVGTGVSSSYDANTSNLPTGGIIVSVGSIGGFGYQPLVSAGGTAIVSGLGTISSISIGNSGSGYRVGVQTVRVGVGTSSTTIPNIQFIGTATVSNGRIVSVAVTNPGTGYTSTNPPYVFIDAPLSYSNIPLVYSSSSSSGLGTGAVIDIVVGQGSSIIDFEIRNTGYGYGIGEILTVPIGGIAGIQTTLSFSEFQISIQNTFNDKFSGWFIGELQLLDSIDNLFDGQKIVFPIKYQGNLVSILSSRGSNINVQDSLLVFVNDVLQVPGKGYIFSGGSVITFTEPPKVGDVSKIIFYKGSGSIDVVERNILETVKIGDELTIGYDSSIGQSSMLQEESRTVASINSTNILNTNPYFGPGNITDPTLLRPVVWRRQTEDKIIDGKSVGKDRILYESLIYPTSYLIQSVGIGSTIAFVQSIRPFFNPINENNISLSFQNYITLVSQDSKVAAAATSVVSAAGTISSIILSDGGVGYTTAPTISIENPVGLGTTQRATASTSITSGIVTSISITGPGTGYVSSNPPVVLIESPTFQFENNTANSFEGDFGIISGISTTSVGVASTGIVFDFVIPKNSFLRNSSITGVTTISGIQTGYYFIINNSNVGRGLTSLNSLGSTVGVGSTFLDNVYQVASVSIAQTSAIGFGVTYVAKVTVSVSSYNGLTGIGFSNFYGEYSWGRVILGSRSKDNSYNAYTSNGYTGISTGTILKRTNPLKYLNYIP